MKYYGTYSCGHEGHVNIVGPGKDREWKKERAFSGLCPECAKKKLEKAHARKNKEAAEKSIELDLPDLMGSPKQVAWANTIRLKFADWPSALIERTRENGKNKVMIKTRDDQHLLLTLNEILELEQYIYADKTEAKFWIDSRFKENSDLLYKLAKQWKLRIPQEVQAEREAKDLALTVEPKSKIKEGIVRLVFDDGYVKARYIKDDTFREIIKSLGYSWEGVWSKKITEYSGLEQDRIAEVGNKLLASGFTVCFPDSKSRDMAISGNFAPECTRWVKYNTGAKTLSLSWKGRSDDIYQKVKRLSGARWSQGSMLVPLEFYTEVLEFASSMDFNVSELARKEIADYIDSSKQFMKAEIKEPAAGQNNQCLLSPAMALTPLFFPFRSQSCPLSSGSLP